MKIFNRWMYFDYSALNSNLISTGISYQGYHWNRIYENICYVCIISLLHRIRYIHIYVRIRRAVDRSNIRKFFLYIYIIHSTQMHSTRVTSKSVLCMHTILLLTHIITPHIYCHIYLVSLVLEKPELSNHQSQYCGIATSHIMLWCKIQLV